ncbi:MAG: hypothetical protein RLZZ179_1542 [Verrucomicrobiota bacterium]|jgi:hypothetical protein
MTTSEFYKISSADAVRATTLSFLILSLVTGLEAAEITGVGNKRFGQGLTQESPDTGVSVVAGWEFNAVLSPGGSVNVWGRMDEEAVLSGAVQVSAGMRHVLGVTSEGKVVAWGSDLNGITSVPDDLPPAMGVAAGAFHSVALLRDGTVKAWGFAGDGRTNPPAGLRNVIAVAAGRDHTLALKSDGTVTAWGGDSHGQCKVPSALSGVIAIAAGGFHSLALKSDGTVTAWGSDEYGQISVPAGLSGVTAIAAGLDHGLALKADGTVTGWGNNSSGQLNLSGGGYTAISAGYRHSVGLRGGPVLDAQPQGGLFYGGSEVTLSAGTQADGASFQWLLNGREISGATGRTLNLQNLTASHAGLYSVRVSTAAGSTISHVTPLVVRGRARTALELTDDGTPLVTVTDEFQQPITPALAEGYHLEVSDNLTDWRRSTSRPVNQNDGSLQFTDTRDPNASARFFRITQD